MSDDIHIGNLWQRWLPLEQLDSRPRICRNCGQPALPWQSWCQVCKDTWLAKEDQRIRRRRRPAAGFTEECVRCGSARPATWVTRHESWSVHMINSSTFRVSMEGLCFCTYCLDCMEYLLGHPSLVKRRYPYPRLVKGDCVYWQRNIVPIRKVKDAEPDLLAAEVGAILRDLSF